MKSALEIEFSKLARRAVYSTNFHDRAVIVGFALCVVPFPPSNIVGIVVNLVNIILVATGALRRNEIRFIILGFAIATINLLAFSWVFSLVDPRLVELWQNIYHNLLHPLFVRLDGGRMMPSGSATSFKQV